MRLSLRSLAAGAAAAAILSAGAAFAAAELPKNLAVTAYDVGSSGYSQAVAVGAAFKNNLGVTLRVLPGKNDVSRMVPLREGKVDFSFNGIGTYFSQEGVDVFGTQEWGPQDARVLLTSMGDNCATQHVAADAGVKTLADLKGKRVSVGAPRSGTELNARAVLKAAGLSYQDLGKVEYLPFGESVELIKNRQLDATLQSAGLGVASIRDLATSVKIVVVPVPADVIAKSGDPAYQGMTIPAGTYEGQDADVPTTAVNNFLVSHSGVSDEIAYKMTKALFEHLDQMVSAHSAAKSIRLEKALAGMPLPLHPGAEKFYREKGILK